MKWITTLKFKHRANNLQRYSRYELRFRGTNYNNEVFVSHDIEYGVDTMRTYIRSYNNAYHTLTDKWGISIFSLGVL